jgi:hypothetical protein
MERIRIPGRKSELNFELQRNIGRPRTRWFSQILEAGVELTFQD